MSTRQDYKKISLHVRDGMSAAGDELSQFEVKQMLFVANHVAAGMDKGFCVQVAQVSQLRDTPPGHRG